VATLFKLVALVFAVFRVADKDRDEGGCAHSTSLAQN
jgi:hypothetical protein